MKETELKLRIVGDPVLRKRAKPVKEFDDRRKEILSRMSQIMYEASGVGLAAPQVGIDEAMIVVDIGTGLYKLINPKILKRQGRQAIEEGCLSVPGVTVKVPRAKIILVQAYNDDFQKFTFEARDLLACVIQHEIDHLYGKLILDYASFMDKLRIKGKLSKLTAKKNEELPEQKRKFSKM